MNRQILIITLLLLVLIPSVNAQAIWTMAGVKHDLNKSLVLFAEGEGRTNNGLSVVERWNVNAGFNYKIIKPLRFMAGYSFINERDAASTTDDGYYIPAFWHSKHRFYTALRGSVEWNNFTFWARERYQMTHRVGRMVPKYKIDDPSSVVYEPISSNTKHIIRFLIGVEYKTKKINLKPYANWEIYHLVNNGVDREKIRYTVGSEYTISKHNSVDLYYRYISHSDDREDVVGHVIGIGYQFRF